MALAETANLVTAMGWQDKGYTSGLQKANRSLDSYQKNLFQTGKGIGQLGAGAGKVATNLLKLGAAGATALAGFVGVNLKAGLDRIKNLELGVAQTNAVIKSTKGIAGQTADSIRTLSEKYEGLNATMDDLNVQAGANMLLTFTNIHKQAFEPALKVVLDMNQAMGKGPEGLTNTAILVGKALNDPIKGATALRRVGVTLTKQQQDQIKVLVGQNNLYGAQQIILKELATEFGGSFAAAGDTAAGRMATLKDNVEGLQQTFAGPFAGVLDRIVGKLGAFLGETGTVDAVARLGSAIAGAFTDERIDAGIGVLRKGLELLSPENLGKAGDAIHGVFDFVKNIDFETIGKGLQITAGIAKTAIDAFLSLPPEVQSIAIAALAANKLSGGLLASGVGNIAGGLLKLALGSLKTITAAEVTVIGTNVISPGGGGLPIGGGPGGLPPIGFGTLAIGAALTAAVAYILIQAEKESHTPKGQAAIQQHNQQSHWGGTTGVTVPVKDADTAASLREGLPPLVSEFKRSRATSDELYHLESTNQAQRNAQSATQLQKLAQQDMHLQQIAAKPFSTRVNVNVTSKTSISINDVIRNYTNNITAGATGSGPGGAVNANDLF